MKYPIILGDSTIIVGAMANNKNPSNAAEHDFQMNKE